VPGANVRQRECTERVPDHTDFVTCGAPVLRADRCAEHLQEEVVWTLKKIKEHEGIIEAYKKRLAALQTESG